MNIYSDFDLYSDEGHNGTDGPLADQARSVLEGHPGTMTGRFQSQEENAQAIPREQTLGEFRGAQTPLRGRTELLAMIDDVWTPPHDEEKANMCLFIAEYIFRDWAYCIPVQEMIEETAIDLMSTPTMNIERIFKRIGSTPKRSSPKLLSRFQILKKEE